MSIANLTTLSSALSRIYGVYGRPSHGGPPLYLTEFGFQSNPPTSARRHAQAAGGLPQPVGVHRLQRPEGPHAVPVPAQGRQHQRQQRRPDQLDLPDRPRVQQRHPQAGLRRLPPPGLPAVTEDQAGRPPPRLGSVARRPVRQRPDDAGPIRAQGRPQLPDGRQRDDRRTARVHRRADRRARVGIAADQLDEPEDQGRRGQPDRQLQGRLGPRHNRRRRVVIDELGRQRPVPAHRADALEQVLVLVGDRVPRVALGPLERAPRGRSRPSRDRRSSARAPRSTSDDALGAGERQAGVADRLDVRRVVVDDDAVSGGERLEDHRVGAADLGRGAEGVGVALELPVAAPEDVAGEDRRGGRPGARTWRM